MRQVKILLPWSKTLLRKIIKKECLAEILKMVEKRVLNARKKILVN